MRPICVASEWTSHSPRRFAVAVLASAFGDRRDMGMDLRSWRCGSVVGAVMRIGEVLASWLFLTSEGSELTRRRGRWVTHKVMEVYAQEISSLQFFASPPWKDPNSDTVRCCAFPLEPGESYWCTSRLPYPPQPGMCSSKMRPSMTHQRQNKMRNQKRCRKEWVELSSTACQSCPVHRAASMEPKRMQSVKSLYIYIYIIMINYTTRKWLSQMRTYPRKSYSYVMSKHTLGGLGPYSYVITTKHRKHVYF